jgi:predicted amidohydrolase YtcJ
MIALPDWETAVKDADRIWTGGTILTMNDAAMRAEAVAEKDGRILAVGAAADGDGAPGRRHRGDRPRRPRAAAGLRGRHGHVFMGGLQALSANMLAPAGRRRHGHRLVQQVLRDWAAANQQVVEQIDLIIGFGYDNAQLAELRHPTRDDLDACRPMCRSSSSTSPATSAPSTRRRSRSPAISADFRDPPGGVIRRGAGGEPDGVLEETAFFGAAQADGRIGEAGARAWRSAGRRALGALRLHHGRGRALVPVEPPRCCAKVADEGGFASTS